MSEQDGSRTGTLFLVPTPLGDVPPEMVLASSALLTVRSLDAFVAESARSARRFLKAAGHPTPLAEIPIRELNQHTPPSALEMLLEPLEQGLRVGLLSEAGCPAVADPGAALVALAHDRGMRVIPLVGPSALLLALMASGMNGQRFCFHGYLAVERDAREAVIRQLEAESRRSRQTQIFIEAPYRNAHMLESLLRACQPTTRLCIATDLTLPGERIATRRVAQWRASTVPELNRRPTVFLLLAD